MNNTTKNITDNNEKYKEKEMKKQEVIQNIRGRPEERGSP
jgi:hypothetical protein